VGERQNGTPIYDYQGVGFHAFHKAAGSVLLAKGKTLKQVRGWLRRSQLTTTMNVYIHQVDDALGGADVMDDIFGATWVRPAATGHPETAANGAPAESRDPALASQISEQPENSAGSE
jgi:hypothetical protein